MPFKLETGTQTTVSHICVLFCPCDVRKGTARARKKALNMHLQVQKGFHFIFVGIPHYLKGYLVYVPGTRKIISSYDVVFNKKTFLYVSIYVTTICRGGGYASGCVIHTLCKIFQGKKLAI